MAQGNNTASSESEPRAVTAPEGQPPTDALALFDGISLEHWQHANGEPAQWQLLEDEMIVTPGSGDLCTRRSFHDIQLHLEWKTPQKITDAEGKMLWGQDRGNSGVFLQNRYEIQVLDSHDNPTYATGQAGAIYKQHPPLINASRPPGVWQSFDIIYTAPRFSGKTLVQTARVTVLHNGVLIQNNVEIKGGTEAAVPTYQPHGPAPLRLQDHGDPVSFRNIWVRKL